MLAGYELHREVTETQGGNGYSPYKIPEQDRTPEVTTLRGNVVGVTAEKVWSFGVTPVPQEAPELSAEELGLLRRQVDFLRSEMHSLQTALAVHEIQQQQVLSQAASNPVAVFILSKIVDAGRLDLDSLTENLTPPDGWIALAQLWRANLIDCLGKSVVPSDAGASLIKWFEAQSGALHRSTNQA